MRHTPRQFAGQTSRSRGINTLIGNGWLRESPRNIVPAAWEARWEHRGRSALRKCMFLPVPQEVRDLAAKHLRITPAALPPAPPPKPPMPDAPRRHPERDVRAMPVYDAREAARRFARENAGKGWVAPAPNANAKTSTAWWEDPIAIGSLLILAPPIGLAAVWSSRRYSSDARWALTVVTGLMMCLATALILAVVATR